MKKKILVVNHQMQLGGVCIAAKSFIENMKDDYEIEYMLAKQNGELDSRIPNDVKVSYINYPLNVASMSKQECKNKGFKYFAKKAYIVLLSRIFGSSYTAKKICRATKKNKQKYDFLINNDMDIMKTNFGACHAYSKYLVDANKKCLVIHGDFIKNNYDKELFINEIMPAYDNIIVLSNALKEQIENLFPDAKDKFVSIPNFSITQEIKNLAEEEEVVFNNGKINIVSASRLTKVKAIMRSLIVFKKLKEERFDFCWYILGDGDERQEIEKYIADNGLEENVVLIGFKSNPYPYIKASNLFYLGSYHEAAPVVINESLILKTPVLTTRTISSEEMLNEKYGWICDNDEEGIYNALKKILSNQKSLKEK